MSTEKTLLSDHYRAGQIDKSMEIARNLLMRDFDVVTIANATGLPVTEIQKLKDKTLSDQEQESIVN